MSKVDTSEYVEVRNTLTVVLDILDAILEKRDSGEYISETLDNLVVSRGNVSEVREALDKKWKKRLLSDPWWRIELLRLEEESSS
jgi:hypothetical protein